MCGSAGLRFASIAEPDVFRAYLDNPADIILYSRTFVGGDIGGDLSFGGFTFRRNDGGSDAVIANVRVRFNPAEGTDLYLVYNEGLNTDRLRRTPVPPVSSDRTLLVKFNYTFNF